jgi:hypothetical protein
MEDEISVTKFETAECHRHPALDVRGEKDERTVLDYHLEVGVEELENEVQIRFRREHVQKLQEDQDDIRYRERASADGRQKTRR